MALDEFSLFKKIGLVNEKGEVDFIEFARQFGFAKRSGEIIENEGNTGKEEDLDKLLESFDKNGARQMKNTLKRWGFEVRKDEISRENLGFHLNTIGLNGYNFDKATEIAKQIEDDKLEAYISFIEKYTKQYGEEYGKPIDTSFGEQKIIDFFKDFETSEIETLIKSTSIRTLSYVLEKINKDTLKLILENFTNIRDLTEFLSRIYDQDEEINSTLNDWIDEKIGEHNKIIKEQEKKIGELSEIKEGLSS